MVDKASYAELGLALPKPSLKNKPSERVHTDGVMDTGKSLLYLGEKRAENLDRLLGEAQGVYKWDYRGLAKKQDITVFPKKDRNGV